MKTAVLANGMNYYEWECPTCGLVYLKSRVTLTEFKCPVCGINPNTAGVINTPTDFSGIGIPILKNGG